MSIIVCFRSIFALDCLWVQVAERIRYEIPKHPGYRIDLLHSRVCESLIDRHI